MKFEEGDVVLCTVEKIEGTLVFVKLDETGEEGNIVTSEIAPGRIRNLRDYVVPKKRIVCKILRIENKNIRLSLRRVTQKEKKEVMEKYKKERKMISILKSILKDKTENIIKEIKNKENLVDFLEESKENSKELEKIAGKEETEKILEILSKEKSKKLTIKKEFSLKTTKPNGLELIKSILHTKEADIRYLAAGRYFIKIESDNLKKADNKIQEILRTIEHSAKKSGCEFSIKGK